MPKPLKIALRAIVALVVVAALVVGGYVAYMQLTYGRIDDYQDLELENTAMGSDTLSTGTTYTATTYNIGFGGYTPDYTFFLDEGVMADGTKTKGVHSVAASKDSVERCTAGAIDTIYAISPDFALWQEVDTDSDRSYHVNQKQMIEGAFVGMQSAFASNFHSAYLAYPFNEPHGRVNAGILSMSDASIVSATRRSYPVDNDFIKKFFDLDRCFMVMRVATSNGHELVLINSHMSAYDSGGTIRTQQLAMLNDVMSYEYSLGNYVIAGGDWNHALCGSIDIYPSEQQVPSWVATLNDSDLPSGFSTVRAVNLDYVATCRGDDIPYEAGVTYTTTIDGFIVSSNVTASAENIDTGFAYSDHNPVMLTFSLNA